MPKRGFNRLMKRRSSSYRSRRNRMLSLVVLALALTLSLGTVLGPWRNSTVASKLRSLTSPVPSPTINPTNPSKEYIYAGGKLVATEEPISGTGGSLAAPANLIATTSWQPGTNIPKVDITWTATSGADHYQIEWTSNVNSSYNILSSNVTTTSFTDTTVTSINAYLYRVRAVDSAGNVSPYSNIDVATAITFTDDPLTTSTLVRGQHVTELRQAVNAIRTSANLPLVTWTDNLASLSGITIKAQHVEELRSKLDEALTTLGIPLSSYSDSTLSGVFIRKVHIDQLRERVR